MHIFVFELRCLFSRVHFCGGAQPQAPYAPGGASRVRGCLVIGVELHPNNSPSRLVRATNSCCNQCQSFLHKAIMCLTMLNYLSNKIVQNWTKNLKPKNQKKTKNYPKKWHFEKCKKSIFLSFNNTKVVFDTFFELFRTNYV